MQDARETTVLEGVIGDASGVRAPHFEQYFGPWAMHEPTFLSAFDRISRMDLRSHASRQRVKGSRRAKALRGLAIGGASAEDVSRQSNYAFPVTSSGVAVLTISGVMLKHVGSLEDGTSTVRVRRHLRGAAGDPQISGVMIIVDSPGGAVAGTRDLAEDIAAVAAVKPVHVYADGMCCSACMWASSQAGVISAGADAIVGSVGTYMPVYDFSGWAAQEGIAVTIVKEGEFKGAGTPGTKVTPEQIQEWQRTITSLNSMFVAGIAAGLKISGKRAKELNDGRVHVGEEAKALGLVHHVENIDAAMNRMEDAAGKWRKKNPSGAGGRAEFASIAGEVAASQTNDTGGAAAQDETAGSDTSPTEDDPMGEKQLGGAAAIVAAAAGAATAIEPKPASIAELKAAFPDDPAYALDVAGQALTLVEAKAGYADVLAGRLKAANEKLAAAAAATAATAVVSGKVEGCDNAAASATVADAGPKRPGVKAVESAGAAERGAGAASATDEVIRMRDELTTGGRMTRAAAMGRISRDHPELMKEFVDAANAR